MSRSEREIRWRLLLSIENACAGDFIFIDEVLGEYRAHAGGTSATMSGDRRQLLTRDLRYTLEKAKSLGVEVGVVEKGFRRMLAEEACYYLRAGNPTEFRSLATEIGQHCSRSQPNRKEHIVYTLREWPRLMRIVYEAYAALRDCPPNMRPRTCWAQDWNAG